jgi:ABC-type multidrug transport system ATPase subunit
MRFKFLIVYLVVSSHFVIALAQNTCPIDAGRVDLVGLGEACSLSLEDLCESCVCFLGERLAQAGYDVSQLDLDACAVQNLDVLLQNGATIAAFLRVSQCPRDDLPCLTTPPPPRAPPMPTEWLRNTNESYIRPDIEDEFGAVEAMNGTGGMETSDKSAATAGIALGVVAGVVGMAAFVFVRFRSQQRWKLREIFAHNVVPRYKYPTTVELKNVTCSVDDDRIIIDDVSATFHPGEIVGVLGPSGCGKTTLMNALVHGNFLKSGTILVNGEELDEKRHNLAFVAQHTPMIAQLSVYETCWVAASLRLPWFLHANELHERTHDVINSLGLTHVSNSRVGGTLSQKQTLSGGELRRVAIAQELVVDPTTIILDEPTSGLDAHTSWRVFTLLRDLASHQEKVVVATVHQPSRRVLDNFHKILVLTQNGRLLWTGSPAELDNTLTMIDMEAPPGVSTAEWLLDIACDEAKQNRFICAVQATRDEKPSSVASKQHSRLQVPAAECMYDEYTSAIKTARVLLWRAFAVISRERRVLVSHYFTPIVIGLILGLLTDATNDLEGFQNRMGSTFFLLVYFALSAMTLIDGINNEREIARRQVRAKFYGSELYFFTKLAIDWLFLRIPPACLAIVVFYFLMGLRLSFTAFFTFLAFILLFILCQSAQCATMTFVSTSTAAATLANTVVLLVDAVFAGFLINVKLLPRGSAWVRYLSPFYFSWGGILASEMRGGPYLFNADFDGQQVKVPVRGATYLNVIGVEYDHVGRNLFGLTGLLCACTLCGLFAIKFGDRIRQRHLH